jgi:orsellinic acid C2-O-methyltransferase
MGDEVDAVVWMLRGGHVAMVLRAGCRLRVFDQILEPRTAAEVAAAVGGDDGAVARFLRTLVDLGLADTQDGRYVATARGATLSAGHDSHVRELVLMQTDLSTVASWHDLEHALRSGDGVYERVNGMSHWEYMSRDPVAEQTFNEAMARRGSAQVAMLLESVDLDGVRTLVDVGGGRGAMLAGLLEARPGLTGVVADRPAVAKEATAFLASAGLGDRGSGVGCDFFSSVPSGADVYTMAHILHDWTDEDCVRILRTLQASMPRQARLMVIERVLDAPGRPPALERDLHLMDLHMLVMFGARERTQAEYDALLAAGGFTPSRLGGTGDWNVLEARPAT